MVSDESLQIQTASVFIAIVFPKPRVGSDIELIHTKYWEGGMEERRQEGKKKRGKKDGMGGRRESGGKEEVRELRRG